MKLSYYKKHLLFLSIIIFCVFYMFPVSHLSKFFHSNGLGILYPSLVIIFMTAFLNIFEKLLNKIFKFIINNKKHRFKIFAMYLKEYCKSEIMISISTLIVLFIMWSELLLAIDNNNPNYRNLILIIGLSSMIFSCILPLKLLDFIRKYKKYIKENELKGLEINRYNDEDNEEDSKVIKGILINRYNEEDSKVIKNKVSSNSIEEDKEMFKEKESIIKIEDFVLESDNFLYKKALGVIIRNSRDIIDLPFLKKLLMTSNREVGRIFDTLKSRNIINAQGRNVLSENDIMYVINELYILDTISKRENSNMEINIPELCSIKIKSIKKSILNIK